ncbi:hypothetical protein Dimus_010090 [Dionaea muscipula]
MEGEISSFIEVWLVAITSVCYCYHLSKPGSIIFSPPGFTRLLVVLPVIILFLFLPLSLSSFHLGAPTAFYLAWLANFKLLLFSFHLGPLSPPPSPLPLSHFVSIALLPIKVSGYNLPLPRLPLDSQSAHEGRRRSFLSCVIKVISLGIIVKSYQYRDYLPRYAILGLYSCHLYLGVEIILRVSGVLARTLFGLDFCRQFNEPYKTTSLQDFWGRRWNLIVSDILRSTVYDPVRCAASPVLGRRWAQASGMLVTFVVSGLMHEVLFFYLTRVGPTWEVTRFFVLHGLCTVVEMVVKRAVAGKFRLNGVVSGTLTIAFVAITNDWLFLPQIVRNGVDLKTINEYQIMFNFVKENILW